MAETAAEPSGANEAESMSGAAKMGVPSCHSSSPPVPAATICPLLEEENDFDNSPAEEWSDLMEAFPEAYDGMPRGCRLPAGNSSSAGGVCMVVPGKDRVAGTEASFKVHL
ncbi:hypothetical protein ACFQ5Q_19040 [Luteolibacter ambystomatis]|uniref:hypothetical protein n=1 Tax=Luteolibacter ambystomatis TaxID=2824561 RepID=UPI003626502D